jgi:hypothetical protein
MRIHNKHGENKMRNGKLPSVSSLRDGCPLILCRANFSSTLFAVTKEVVALFLKHPAQPDWRGLFTQQLTDIIDILRIIQERFAQQKWRVQITLEITNYMLNSLVSSDEGRGAPLLVAQFLPV